MICSISTFVLLGFNVIKTFDENSVLFHMSNSLDHCIYDKSSRAFANHTQSINNIKITNSMTIP